MMQFLSLFIFNANIVSNFEKMSNFASKFANLIIIMAQEDVFKKIISHCKEYGFVFPSSDIYDGLGAVYDYGQNGVELKKGDRIEIGKAKHDTCLIVLENRNFFAVLREKLRGVQDDTGR